MHNVFRFMLFCRITYDPFCSVAINIATFHRLGFTFIRRYTVVKNKRKTLFGQPNTYIMARKYSDLIVNCYMLFAILDSKRTEKKI